MHQQQVLCYCCRRFHWLLFEDCWETADHTLSCLNLLHTVLNRLCKWAYGGHIGSNQKIVWRASTTGVVLLLCKVSLISVWRLLRNSWSHIAMSQPLTYCFEPFMQISLWRPYWIESRNCFTCINNRCCVTVVQGFIDFCLKTAEKQLITYVGLQLLTDGRTTTDGRTDDGRQTDASWLQELTGSLKRSGKF